MSGSTAMRFKSWSVVVGGMLATTAALGGFKFVQISSAIAAAQAMPEPSEAVEAVQPRRGTWSSSARAVGTVASVRRVDLRNELSGTIAAINFASGDVVEQGQVLLRLDTREEEADLAAARAEAELARLTLERRQRLVTSQAGTAADLDRARAELSATRARVARLEARIAKKTLVAPFTARVGIRDLQPGAFLPEGTLVTTLQGVDADAYVDFALPQDAAATLATGGTVRVTGAALPPEGVEARIAAREAAVSDASRSVRFRAVLAGLGDRVPPGAFLDVSAPVGAAREAVFVPLTAVRRAAYGDHVFVLAEDGGALRARQQFVRLGPVQGEEAVVLSGVEPGQRIAAKGSFKLREGLAVRVDPAAAGTAATGAGTSGTN